MAQCNVHDKEFKSCGQDGRLGFEMEQNWKPRAGKPAYFEWLR